MKKEDLIWPLIAFSTILAFFVFHVDHRDIEQAYAPQNKIRETKFNKNQFDVSYNLKKEPTNTIFNNKLEENIQWTEFNYRVLLENVECLAKKLPNLALLQTALNGRDLLLTSENTPHLNSLRYDVTEKNGKYSYHFNPLERHIQMKKFKQPGQHLVEKLTLNQDSFQEHLNFINKQANIHTYKYYNWQDQKNHDLSASFYDGKLINLNIDKSSVTCSLSASMIEKITAPVQLTCSCRK